MLYTGAMEKGQMHGKGSLTYPNSEKYDGDFVHGKREGSKSLAPTRSSHTPHLHPSSMPPFFEPVDPSLSHDPILPICHTPILSHISPYICLSYESSTNRLWRLLLRGRREVRGRVGGGPGARAGHLRLRVGESVCKILKDLIHPKKKKKHQNIPNTPYFPDVATPFLPRAKTLMLFFE